MAELIVDDRVWRLASSWPNDNGQIRWDTAINPLLLLRVVGEVDLGDMLSELTWSGGRFWSELLVSVDVLGVITLDNTIVSSDSASNNTVGAMKGGYNWVLTII